MNRIERMQMLLAQASETAGMVENVAAASEGQDDDPATLVVAQLCAHVLALTGVVVDLLAEGLEQR